MGVVEYLRRIPDIHFTENETMSDKTSLGVGGKARYYACPESVHAFNSCLATAREFGIEYKIIGNGTNLLVSDAGYNGLVIRTLKLNRVLLDKGEIIALCGTPIHKLVSFIAGCGRVGAEGLAGIPASVGGAICQNASAFGYSVSDFLRQVTCVKDGKVLRLNKEDCAFGYRKSLFKKGGYFIVSAKFAFPKRKHGGKADKLPKKDYLSLRKSVQPTGRTCGSVFENPAGDFAGRIIESAGLKGLKVGGAFVSEKHANFIIAENGATAKDVFTLINEIKRTVYDKFGVRLKEEVEYLGKF